MEKYLNAVDTLSDEEKKKISLEFNDFDADYPIDRTIFELFQDQAQKTPDRIAVVYDKDKLTYKELNDKSNRLARTLTKVGIKPNTIVGIMVEPSVDMIVAIIGILKAGGAYLPIAPEYPKDRIAYILENSKADILLTHSELTDRINTDIKLLRLDDNKTYSDDDNNVGVNCSSNDLCYVIYTSGTTGYPKGVLIEHRNVVNLSFGLYEDIYSKYGEKLNVALIAPYVFDASVQQIFPALLFGNTLYIVPKDVKKDGQLLLRYYDENLIDISDGTPVHINLLVNAKAVENKELTVKHFIIGGDVFSVKVAQDFYRKYKPNDINFTNVYGPTECCVDSTLYQFNKESIQELTNMPIGKPMHNYHIYILGEDLELLPIGVIGELYIAGNGVGRGYLNKEELTKERYIQNPFSPNEIMYRTGDYGRWTQSGEIEFFGRKDQQVKIRGFRIELGEIENKLLDFKKNEPLEENGKANSEKVQNLLDKIEYHSSKKNSSIISKAVVLDIEDENSNKYLCAYFVSDENITLSELREYLSYKLPEYMIPSYFVRVDDIPVTINGKVDRNALIKEKDILRDGTEYLGPENEIEMKLQKIWHEILGIERISVNENFFELGGHSLKAMTMIAKISKQFNVDVPIKELFNSPTIEKLSKFIESADSIIHLKIEKVEEKEYYATSSVQKRMFALNQVSKEETNYNEPAVMIVEGRLERNRLEESFSRLIQRHEAFRTSFVLIDGEIMQKIHKDVEFKVEYEEIDNATEELIEREIERFIKPFDLTKAPLLRVKLVKLNEEKYIMMFDTHHIITDGTSMSIIMEELSKLYEGEGLKELSLNYKDYSAWENRMMGSEAMKKQEEYWVDIFKDKTPVLNLPIDYPRPNIQSFEGGSIRFKLDKDMTEKIKELSNINGVTLYMTLLAVYNVLLAKYSSQEDIVVASPIEGRPHDDLKDIVGIFVNTLAVRNYPSRRKAFIEFLQEVKETALSAYDNQDYPFDKLVEKLNIRKDLSRNALFDTMFVLQNTENKGMEIPGLRFKEYEYQQKISKFDLSLIATETETGIDLSFEFSTKLFKRETIERMTEQFIAILEEIMERPEVRISDIEMMTDEERKKVASLFNETAAEYPSNKTVHELLEDRVKKSPESIAVVYEKDKLTYRELNDRSNRLARTLIKEGIGPDTIVGIMVEPSIDMIVGIIGILKAGGAYMPIAPEYPRDRIAYILENSKTEVLLTHSEFADRVNMDIKLLKFDDDTIYSDDNGNVEVNCSSDKLCYVIYTSGTTGYPKGVLIEHRNVVNLSFGLYEDIYSKYGENLKVALIAQYVFDASVQQIFPTLLFGHTLYIVPKDVKKDGELLLRYYDENLIDISDGTPVHINMLVNARTVENKKLTVKHFIIGGEVFSVQVAQDFYKKYKPDSISFTNVYGPTECCVDATSYQFNKESIQNLTSIPIGGPMHNDRIYILGDNLELLPIGVIGELYIAGNGVGRGYLNNGELTKEKFIQNPFNPNEIMYKTGDYGRWTQSGEIEFFGRKDQQVKIRGFRIELGEIESCLLKLSEVKEAIIIDREDEGNKYLCAYLVSETEQSTGKLREELKKSLPDYMIPSYFITLKEMPVNQSGKIDRKALPMPDGNIETGTEYIAPRNKVEEKLVKIWNEILGVDKIGINDDFFILGGHSLKAIKMAAIIKRELLVDIPVGEIFNRSTVLSLGKYIDENVEGKYSPIEPVEKREVYEVSSAQRRLFALNQFSKDETHYNMPSVMVLEGKLDREKLVKSFEQLVQRHEAFRTSFELINGEIVQRINDEAKLKVEYEEVKADEEEVIKREIHEFVKPFDLSEAPLLRVKLIKLDEEKYVLMFDMHHIISDGISMSVIVEELTRLYKGETQEKPRVQYKDYSAWENKMLNSEAMKKHEEHWIKTFSSEIPVLNMPTDYPRPNFQSFEGENIDFWLDRDLRQKLMDICNANGVTMYMTLLSAYNILLSKYSGQEDIIVGSPIAGRSHADLHDMVGMFVNTLAMRNYPSSEKTFKEFVVEVKRNALKAYENQDYQFDRLVEKLDIRKDLSRNALFDTMFVQQNTEVKEIQFDNVLIVPYQFERGVSKFDMTLSAEEKEDGIRFNLEYCTSLFKRETIERLIGHFRNILSEITKDWDIKLSDINMLSEEERNQTLVDFNNTKTLYPKDKTICEAFKEQVLKTPDNIAAVYEDKKLTFRELNEKSNQLARVLRRKGVKPDDIVGILVDRSLEMMVGIIGVLKAGGAYLPISPDYPDDRIKYMFEDSKTSILLTQRHLLDSTDFCGIVIDLEDKHLYQEDKADLEVVNSSSDLAYVIYTSGSTGNPKGVMIQHSSVINLVEALGRRIYNKYTSNLNVALIAQYVFDASVKQIFASLLRGYSLHIIPEEYRTEGEKLIDYYIDNSIDISDGTPSHLKLILSDNKEKITDIPVKHFIIGGEELPVNVAKDFLAAFKNKKPDITNIYGPTECCVDTTAFLVDSNKLDKLHTIPIGGPLMNYKVYVLDKNNKPEPIGVAGELCIGGEGLARGYLNRPELTDEKFVANPFEHKEKMYRTGDLVRWLPDGNIEFLGRIDHQVKIRGYRIEIGEIEAAIKNYPSVQDSVVMVWEDDSKEKRLVAYVVPRMDIDEKYSEGDLRENLKKKLPKYMIPSIFVRLEHIPLNTNGKVDRFALPEPDMLQRNSDESFVAPRNKEEIEMAEIWSRVLGIEKIGIDDDFFDLGGDSFKAIKLVRSISSNLGVMELFKNSTIRDLTAYLSKGASAKGMMLHELTKPVDEKKKVVSLICFPYGGGSAISYQALANVMPKNYSLYSVELPGHDYSCPDEELLSIEESALRCLEEIKQKVKGPVVLYGHCLGATMAAATAFKLEEAGISVDGVIMGAMFPAPRISNRFFNIWEKIFPSQLTNKANRDMLKTLGGLTSDIDHDETEFILRNLKHDAKECTNWYTQFYNNRESQKFKAPITCVIGEGDRATEFYQERYKEWLHFSDEVDLKTIENAGHFFFKNQAEDLIYIIKTKVDLWQGRSEKIVETGRTYESMEMTASSKTPASKVVVPNMKLFLIVAIVQIISEIGTILSTFGTGIWVFKQTNALSQFAMMFLFNIIPTIIILPLSGAIVDRFDRRKILIGSDIISSICSLGLLILLCNNGLQIWQVYLFTVIASIANCFRQPAYLAAITQIAPKIYLTQANSVSQFSVAIGGILASICGGLFIDSIGFKGLVAIDLVTFVISLVALLFLRFPNTMFTRLEEPIFKELMGGWNFIIKRKSMVAMVIFFLIVNFLVSIFDVTMTPLVLTFAKPSILGIVNAFSGIGVLIGAIAMLATGGTKKRAMGMVGFVIPEAIFMIIAGVRPSPVFAAVALFGIAFSIAIINIHWQSLIQVKVGLELQGRVFAFNRMMVSVLSPISFITAGVLADKVFAPMMKYSMFNSSAANLILGAGPGRAMRLTLLIAGALLLIWSIIGVKYKSLSEMDTILEDAVPDTIIIKDKDKLQKIADQKVKVNLYSETAEY